MPTEKENLLFFSSQSELRDWLCENHQKEIVLWVGYYKKKTTLPSISWPESVDEGLCFGWIDGLRKSINATSYKIRFTPRKKNSHWSTVNLRRYKELENLDLITPAGKASFERRNIKNEKRASYEQEQVELNPEYLDQIKSIPNAYAYYCTLSPYYQRASNWYIMSSKSKNTQLKRLQILIKSCEAGEKIPAFNILKKKKSN